MLRPVALAIFAALYVTAPATAQQLERSVKFGVSVGSLSNAPELADVAHDDSSATSGLQIGAALAIGGTIALQSELLIASRGATFPDDTVAMIRYLEIPVLAKISLPMRGTAVPFVFAGPSVAIRLTASLRDTDQTELTALNDRVHRSDFGFSLGGGATFDRLVVEGRFYQGLRNISTIASQPETKTRAVSVLLGVRF